MIKREYGPRGAFAPGARAAAKVPPRPSPVWLRRGIRVDNDVGEILVATVAGEGIHDLQIVVV